MNDKQTDEHNELFDSTVREKFAGHEPLVPHALWTRISAELDGGNASGETDIAPAHHSSTGFAKWRIAMAAAILLTLVVGSILSVYHPKGETNTAAASVASKTAPKTEVKQSIAAAPAAHELIKTKTTVTASAIVRPIAVQHIAAVSTKAEETTTVPNTTTATVAPVEKPAAKPELTAEEMQLEFADPSTVNKPVETGNIPVYSLNLMSSPQSLNDEITVIKSAPDKKKRHGKKDEEEATKVILIGKKFESKPDIRYQVPVRF